MMETVNFSQFDLRSPVLTSDYIIGYKTDGTAEFRTRVIDIINTIIDSDNQTLSYDPFSYVLTIDGGNQVDLYSIISTFASNSSNYESVFNSVKNVSANWDTAYAISTQFQNSSASFAPINIFQNLTGNWQSTYVVVQSNSATAWNYQGTDLKELSSNWQSTYTTMSLTSSQWDIAYDTATAYSNVSSTFATNTNLNSVSSLLTPLTLTNNLTSQLVLNTNFDAYKTSVAASTATLLPTSIYRGTSGIFESTYTTVKSNSSVAWNYQGTDIKALTGKFDSNYTTVNTNSANWNYGYDVATYVQANSADWEESAEIIPTVTNYLSTNNVLLSGATVTGDISATGILFGRAQDVTLIPTSTATVTNSAVTAALQLLVSAPTYLQPTASLTNFSPVNYELGDAVNRSLTQSWNQNDAGSLSMASLLKNGNLVSLLSALPQVFNVNESAVLGTTTYVLSVNFNQGPIKNNILGFSDNRGRINAGVITASQSYTGFYRRWIGSAATFPSNANDVRTLGLTTTLDTNTTLASQASPVFINNRFILIAIPNTRVLTSVITEANENLTSQFNLSSVQIQDAGGTNQNYKLYYLETALSLNANLTNVTITNS